MKRTSIKASLVVTLTIFSGISAFGAPLVLTGTSGSLSAQATFTNLGSGQLQVVLANISTSDVLIPADVLTALFFDLPGVGPLTPVSALLNGSLVYFGPDGGGNVGGEWIYASGIAGAPGGATEAISSSGLGIFGNPNFNGSNLQGPDAVDGLQYGIVSAGDNMAAGNAAVTGNFALIKNSVTFVLSGIGSGFDPSAVGAITNVSFQYGTALSEPNIPCCGQQVPEPTSIVLLGMGLLGVAGAARSIRK